MKRAAQPLLLALILVASYGPALRAPFLFDDLQNISNNPAAKPSALGFSEINEALTEGPGRSRPVSQLSFALGHLLHGPSPANDGAV